MIDAKQQPKSMIQLPSIRGIIRISLLPNALTAELHAFTSHVGDEKDQTRATLGSRAVLTLGVWMCPLFNGKPD